MTVRQRFPVFVQLVILPIQKWKKSKIPTQHTAKDNFLDFRGHLQTTMTEGQNLTKDYSNIGDKNLIWRFFYNFKKSIFRIFSRSIFQVEIEICHNLSYWTPLGLFIDFYIYNLNLSFFYLFCFFSQTKKVKFWIFHSNISWGPEGKQRYMKLYCSF